jgi:hypothetical protein
VIPIYSRLWSFTATSGVNLTVFGHPEGVKSVVIMTIKGQKLPQLVALTCGQKSPKTPFCLILHFSP